MKRLKQLDDENAQLKKIVADVALDEEMLLDVIRLKLRSLAACANLLARRVAIGRCRPAPLDRIEGPRYPKGLHSDLPAPSTQDLLRPSGHDRPHPSRQRAHWLPVASAYLFAKHDDPATAVLFNTNCPVCCFEIGHYARYCRDTGLPIRFDDLNSAAHGGLGIDADSAARRLYVLHNGQLTSGIPTFLVLWAQMPRYRWLARFVGLPTVRQIASAFYNFLLAPVIYRWHLRRLRRQTSAVSR